MHDYHRHGTVDVEHRFCLFQDLLELQDLLVFQVVRDFRDNRDRLDHRARPASRAFRDHRGFSRVGLDRWDSREVRAPLDLRDYQVVRVVPVDPVVLGHPVPLDFQDLLDHLEASDSQDFQDHPDLLDNPVISITLQFCCYYAYVLHCCKRKCFGLSFVIRHEGVIT